jgi:hypothetical protein
MSNKIDGKPDKVVPRKSLQTNCGRNVAAETISGEVY